MFLKRKRCGKIKGCGCADGRKQRAYIAKEDSTAPTVGVPDRSYQCLGKPGRCSSRCPGSIHAG